MASATLSSVKPPAIKKGFVNVLAFELLPVKRLPTSCYRSIKEQIIGTGLRKSCIFPHLNSANRLLGKLLQDGFIHRSMHLYQVQAHNLASLLHFFSLWGYKNTDFLNSLWNPCSQLPSLLQRDLPFAWCKDKTNVVRTGFNSGLDGFRSGQSANFNLCQSATPLLFQPHCLPS